MSVGEEKSSKLNNNKLFEHDRRANGGLFVAWGTCSRDYILSQFVYCLLPFCVTGQASVADTATAVVITKKPACEWRRLSQLKRRGSLDWWVSWPRVISAIDLDAFIPIAIGCDLGYAGI